MDFDGFVWKNCRNARVAFKISLSLPSYLSDLCAYYKIAVLLVMDGFAKAKSHGLFHLREWNWTDLKTRGLGAILSRRHMFPRHEAIDLR